MSSLSGKQSEMGPLAAADKNKQWQRELLMERLRSHSSQHKTFPELSKAMRMSMLEKRYALDSVEKSNLQKCLDSMQHCIKVTTRQGLIERLESLSRQLGLKFMEDTSGLFISSDMFYLEIILDPNGTVSDVKVHHECKIEQQSCSELVTCLLKGDFTDFTNQLEGLSSIYQLNAEPKIKSKAFVALQAMETDLYNLFSVQDFHKDAQVVLLESIVGIVQKRRGGHPMKLTYFVPPYELLDLETKSLLSLSVDLIAAKNIGMSVTVNLEASSANKLQILPTVSFKKDTQGVSIPIYSQMSPANSTMLPATFVLRLNKPLPLCQNLRAQIIQTTELNFGDNKPLGSVMDLIVQNASNGQLQTASKGLFVTLPDQVHCYFLTENRQMEATLVTSVPFTEPGHVPQIISLLRQQAVFYTLLASCIRTQNKITDLDGISMLEVNASSIHQVSVALEHPFEESMATVEFDLSDPINVTCRIYSLTNNYDAIAVKLSKIVQKSMSIPITIRSLMKFWEQEQMKGFHRSLENGNFNLPLGPTDPGGRGHEFRDLKEKNERNSNGGFPSNGRQFFHPSGVMMSSNETFNEGNVNMFEAPADGNIIMSQFAVKTANDGNLNDVTMANTKEISPVVGEDFYKSPKSKVDLINSQTVTDNSDSNSLGKSTKTSDQGVATTSTTAALTEFQLQQEKATSFPIKEMEGKVAKTETKDESNLGAAEKHSTIENIASKPRSMEAPVRSSVSITPVTAAGIEFNTVLSNMGLERRPGIEIIPISASATPSLPTSITITPINSSKVEKKSSSSKKSEDRSKSDRKRKRKREESTMGPPEKVIGKSDALNRPVSVSIKSADGAPVSPSGILRKFSSSPIPKPPSLSTATSSSSAGSSASASGSGKPSPKHSPVQNSPKHIPSGIHSPKGSPYGTASPKHSSSGSSGKPSMSALKSAANSPNSKSDKTISKSTSSSSTSTSSGKERGDKDKDKDRSNRTMPGGASPKLKTSTIKLKQIDLSAVFLPANEQIFEENSVQLATSGGQQLDASAAKSLASGGLPGSQNKVRKGSLSAVIDKLKSAQTPNDDIVGGSQMPSQQQKAESDDSQSSGKEKSPSSSAGNKSVVGASTSSGIAVTPINTQNSEYMVKPSLDGMKITINKTRTKDVSSSNNKTHFSSSSASTTTSTSSNVSSTQSPLSSASSSLSSNTSASIFSKLTSSGSSSPKRTTGLKPGVNSGPASKKAQLAQSTSKSSNTAAAQSSLGKGVFLLRNLRKVKKMSMNSNSKITYKYIKLVKAF